MSNSPWTKKDSEERKPTFDLDTLRAAVNSTAVNDQDVINCVRACLGMPLITFAGGHGGIEAKNLNRDATVASYISAQAKEQAEKKSGERA